MIEEGRDNLFFVRLQLWWVGFQLNVNGCQFGGQNKGFCRTLVDDIPSLNQLKPWWWSTTSHVWDDSSWQIQVLTSWNTLYLRLQYFSPMNYREFSLNKSSRLILYFPYSDKRFAFKIKSCGSNKPNISYVCSLFKVSYIPVCLLPSSDKAASNAYFRDRHEMKNT